VGQHLLHVPGGAGGGPVPVAGLESVQ
jgi:hypothetical protein